MNNNPPTYSPQEISDIQKELSLSDREFAKMLGFKGAQNIRRLKSTDPEAGSSRSIQAAQVRLIDAYLKGYRPDDWPV